MEAVDDDPARSELGIPEEFQVEAMATVGRPGRKEDLPDKLLQRETRTDRRKVRESICEGRFRSWFKPPFWVPTIVPGANRSMAWSA
jgi:hypothetical protein